MTSFLLFYSCCFRPNWLQPIHPQLRREPREKLAPLVLSFLTLFNLQGTRPSSGTFAIISDSVRFVKHFFSNLFQIQTCSAFWTSSPSNSLVRIPDTKTIVNTSFDALGTFFQLPLNSLHNTALCRLLLIQFIFAISCAYLFFLLLSSFCHIL